MLKNVEKTKWVRGLCGICPAGCWVEVKRKEGRIIDIRADQTHTLGMICERGKHAPEIIYSENRLKYPLRRKGKKGSYDFERISWDEAFELITKNLNQTKKEFGPEATCIYTGRGSFEQSLCDIFQPRGVAVSSASSLLFPFGSPNTMGVGALCYVSYAMMAPHLTMGRMLINMFTDIENADLLIIWGTNPATDSPPLDMHRLEDATQRGAEVVVIDPMRSETAVRLDAEWVPIRPGTDGALALGLLNILIEEDLYDDDFAQNYTLGFDELKTYIQHFRPEVVEEITSVPAQTIISLAERIGNSMAACPVMYTGLEYSNSGLQTIRAILTLFALAGHLDSPGGIGLAMLNSGFAINKSCNQVNPDVANAVGLDKFPLYSHYRSESHASGLVNSILHSDPYKIHSLIIQGASLLTSWPQTDIWRETLSKLDFITVIDRQLTADCAYADVVLPATTMFEIESYAVFGSMFRCREKLTQPVGEARNDYLIMAELAKRLGYEELYPQSEEELLHFVLEGSGFSLDEIRKNGGIAKAPSQVMEYKKWQKGGLRADGKPGFETPSGKFEIYSSLLEEFGYEPLPKYTEPTESIKSQPALAQSFPLTFNSGARNQFDFRSQHHGIDGLSENLPEPTCLLNIDDANKRSISSGDLVKVSTHRGAVHFRALVNDDIVQGAVECSMGGGTPIGPQAWQQWNVNQLTDLENYDDISGFPVYKALLCEVELVEVSQNKDKILTKAVKAQPKEKIKKRTIEKRIYFDNNATTQVDVSVHNAMLPYLGETLGNPSSIHEAGRKSREAVNISRRHLAKLIGAKPKEIIFTSGGSESNNLALKGVVFASLEKKHHIITSAIEHPALLGAASFLEDLGHQVTYLPVDSIGMISPRYLKAALTKDTTLVSIMMANNEVGTLQPIKELCEIAHSQGALFHTDATQAIGKIIVDVSELGVDLLSLSAHKFHGPKGMGALYVRKGIEIEPLIHGSKQENGLRAGTENVPGIVGLGKAAQLSAYWASHSEKVVGLRDRLQTELIKLIPDIQINGSEKNRLPNTLNVTIPGFRGESLVIALDQRGFSLSSGSACKSGSPEPTHVLLAMGKSVEEAHCSLRFSFSHDNEDDEVDKLIEALAEVFDEIENTVRFLSCK